MSILYWSGAGNSRGCVLACRSSSGRPTEGIRWCVKAVKDLDPQCHIQEFVLRKLSGTDRFILKFTLTYFIPVKTENRLNVYRRFDKLQ